MDRRALFLAAEDGNLSQLAKILEQGVVVNLGNEEDLTALHIASANGHDQLVQYLLRKGACLDCISKYGWTPLMYAAYYGHLHIVNLLVQNKANINAQNYLGATPLVCASRCGHVNVVRALIEFEADINQVDEKGYALTPVMTAAQHGHESVVKLLYEHGANVNYRHPITGWTALMQAALNGHLNVVQLLVDECGADPNYCNLNDQVAIDVASIRHRKEIIQYLKGKTRTRPKASKSIGAAIIEAAKAGKSQLLKDMLKNNEKEVDVQDDNGATPLIHASIEGHVDVVSFLISRNANINVQDTIGGWTALMQATFHRHKPIIEMLLRARADVKIREHKKLTVFDLATIVGDPEINRLLAQSALPKTMKSSGKWINQINGSDRGDSFERSPMRSLISKVSGRFQSFKSGKNDVLYSRVQPQSPAAIGGLEMTSSDKSGTLGPTTSLWSIVDASKGTKEKPKISLVAPQAILPDDVMAPVMPFFARRTSFELPRVPKDVKLNSSGGSSEVSSQSSVPTLQINGIYVGAAVKELQYLESFDNLSQSSDGTGSNTLVQHNMAGRHTGRPGSGTAVPPADTPDSPQSSQTSDSSFFTSVSQTRKASMPSAPGNYSRKAAPARRESGYGGYTNHTNITTWRLKHTKPSAGKSPSVVSVNTIHSAPVTQGYTRERGFLRNRHSNSSQMSLPALVGTSMTAMGPGDTEDEFHGILKRLSLENYTAKFEEEEVDMEAFLTMNDGDLREIGVQQTQHRQQILKAIQELNAGKERERTGKDFEVGSVASSKNQTRTSIFPLDIKVLEK